MKKKNSFKSVHNFHSWEKEKSNEFDSVLQNCLVENTELNSIRETLDNSEHYSYHYPEHYPEHYPTMSVKASTTIQRYFRGWNLRQELPSIRAVYYSRMAGEGLGHKTIKNRYRDNPEYPLQYVSLDWLNNQETDESFSHHLWGKPLEERSSETKVGFSSEAESLDTEEKSPIRDFDGPKPENLIIGKIIDKKWSGEFESEEDFHLLFPDVTDEELAAVVAYFSKSLTALKNGNQIMIWDGSSKKVKPFWITASGGKGQAARFEEVYRILASVWCDMKIRFLKEILRNYEFECGSSFKCTVSAVPAVLPRVPSY